MEYTGYRLHFPVGIHIGKGSLEDGAISFGADTLFSALCIEANKRGEEELERLISLVKNEKLVLSDAFPYIAERLYLPKPVMHIWGDGQGSSVEKKAFKQLEYLPVECLEEYLAGQLDAAVEVNYFKNYFGKMTLKVSAAVRGEEETVPYRIGMYQFEEGAGLYIIVGYEQKDELTFVEELLIGLSYEGIGGKRSSGMGRFELLPLQLDHTLQERLGKTAYYHMSLSVCLPMEEELEVALNGACYMLEKRSGFVVSETYADTLLRKKDLFVCRAGACFRHTFHGDVYDVSVHGRHPVYRYAKPLFMGVDV